MALCALFLAVGDESCPEPGAFPDYCSLKRDLVVIELRAAAAVLLSLEVAVGSSPLPVKSSIASMSNRVAPIRFGFIKPSFCVIYV